jgi:hypothetical protein
MNEPGSVSLLVQHLRSEDAAVRNAAALQIWTRFSSQLLRLVRSRLDSRIRVRHDEEDVVQSAYKSLCLRAEQGRFPKLEDRDDFWKLLLTITLNKTRLAVRSTQSALRDPRRETHQSGDPDAENRLLQEMDEKAPTPEEALVLSETLDQIARLDPTLRQIALWRMEGYTNAEIAAADKLDCAERTVQRKIGLIRDFLMNADEPHES